MSFLDEILKIFKGKDQEVTVTCSSEKPSAAKEVLTISGKFEEITDKFLGIEKTGQMSLFFDPEEKVCYVYALSDEKSLEIATLTLGEWKELITWLKAANNTEVFYKGRKLYLCASVFLTNLGERTAVLLFKNGNLGEEKIKELKKKTIQRVNRLKPPTALTHENIKNLIKVVELAGSPPPDDFFTLLRSQEIIEPELLDKYRAEKDWQGVLKLPVSRKLLVRAVAGWLGMGYVDVELEEMDESVAGKLPQNIAEECMAIPFRRNQGKIITAFGNPFIKNNVDKVREALGCDITAVMSCEEDIRFELEKLYKKD